MMFMLNTTAKRSAIDYGAALIEACKTVKPEVDPLRALDEADAYPRLTKIPEVEYVIGWINGVAATLGTTTAKFWKALAPDATKLYEKTAATATERVRR
jgi:hypothetical protein